MRMTVEEIEQASRSIATEYAGDFSILGVTAADGEAQHAELLVEMNRCDEEPCMLQITLPREDRREMEQALRDGFQAALAQHV